MFEGCEEPGKLEKKTAVSGIVLLLLLTNMLSSTFIIQPVRASGTIYIRADGSVEGTDKIEHNGDVYTFTDNIDDEIVVQRDNIIIDGAGYTLQGTGSGTGIDLSGRTNVSVQNLQIKNFEFGVRLISSSNNEFYHNNFVDNTLQVVSDSSTNVWDNGYPSGGNYWSDYTNVDEFGGVYQNTTGSDGIWDNPYIIDTNNMDRYPLAFQYETQPPTISILSPQNKTYTVNASIPLTFTVDEFASWIGYSLNGQPNATITGNTTLPTLPDGWHYVVVYANDTFGNMEASPARHFTVDTTPPTGTITINDGAASTTSTQVWLTISAEDATSGVAQMRFFELVYTDWEEYATSKFWTLNTTGEGYKTVYVQVRDNAGLVSAARSAIIWFGSNPPLSGLDPPPTRVPPAEIPEKTPETIVSNETVPTPSPTPTPMPTPTPASVADLYFVPATIGIITAIAVVGVLLFVLLRKRQTPQQKPRKLLFSFCLFNV
jgi:parallel beta-helix repeat protein